MGSRYVPLRRLASINPETLGDDTDPEQAFRYVDISTTGRGLLVEQPQPMTFATAPSRARRVLRNGDTILSSVRTYLRAVWTVRGEEEDLVASTGFVSLRPLPHVDPRFLGWLAQSDAVVEQVVERSVGVSYPAITPFEVGRIKVPCPGLATQRTIADYLDPETARIDALIDKKRRMVDLLEERASVLISTATAARTVQAPSSLPDGWRMVPLRRCFASMDYGIGTPSSDSGEVYVLGMGNVAARRIVGEPGGRVESVDPQLLLRGGDLLFNRTNSLALVGKVARCNDVDRPTTFASYLVRLRAGSLADDRYLNYLLNSQEVLGLARTMALPSIGQANLNPNRYASMRVPLPPLGRQRVIVDLLDHELSIIDRATRLLTRQMELLRERRQALITAAVDGVLGIPGGPA